MLASEMTFPWKNLSTYPFKFTSFRKKLDVRKYYDQTIAWIDTHLESTFASDSYSHDSIIRPGLIIFKLFKNGLSTVLIIESFDIFWNSTYNRDSTYNFS